ncbi:hypothetical protein SLS64_013450 [Diaporthe eres]|uniref:Protein kinase domain-containing protein n=1 Tax=Diaporthe eres TaxID=83184 RepID=A0ABR1PIK0_DIAER
MAPNTDGMLPNSPVSQRITPSLRLSSKPNHIIEDHNSFVEVSLTFIPQGPKLGKFKNGQHGTVQFVKGLGSGAHSHVWKVKIDGHTYALKMFRHIRAEEENAVSPARLERFGIDLQLLNDQLTPFNCEARAYGRLKETGNEDIAWGCYGYIALDEATYAPVVWDRIGLPRREWFAQSIATDAEVADRPVFPIYALVKEFIPDASRLGALDIGKAHDMAQGINTLHSIGITHRDIQDRNYVDSRIMNFSTSWTVPNVRLDRALRWDPKRLIDEADTNDYFMFDDMIQKWNDEHPDMPPSSYRMTQGDKYRLVAKAPRTPGGKRGSSSSSGSSSSEEMEEIPILERMRDNRYLVLASSYDWVGRKPAVAQPDIIAPPIPGNLPPPEIPGFHSREFQRRTRRRPRGLPRQAPPGRGPPRRALGMPRPAANTLSGGGAAARQGSKLEAIREAAGGLRSACDALKATAQNILDIINADDSPPDDDDDDNNNNNKADAPPGKRRQQQQPAQHPPGAAAQPPERWGRRRRDREDGDAHDDSARPARRPRWSRGGSLRPLAVGRGPSVVS